MIKQKIVCKIYFMDPDSSIIRQIIGQIDTTQLFSALNSFIEVENDINRTINKHDIQEVVIFEEQRRIVIAKDNLEVNYPLQIEG